MYVQIGIQLAGIALLVAMLRFKTIALLLLFPLSVVFTYINAVHTNYGHIIENVMSFVVFWLVYGVLIAKSWKEFPADRTESA